MSVETIYLEDEGRVEIRSRETSRNGLIFEEVEVVAFRGPAQVDRVLIRGIEGRGYDYFETGWRTRTTKTRKPLYDRAVREMTASAVGEKV